MVTLRFPSLSPPLSPLSSLSRSLSSAAVFNYTTYPLLYSQTSLSVTPFPPLSSLSLSSLSSTSYNIHLLLLSNYLNSRSLHSFLLLKMNLNSLSPEWQAFLANLVTQSSSNGNLPPTLSQVCSSSSLLLRFLTYLPHILDFYIQRYTRQFSGPES